MTFINRLEIPSSFPFAVNLGQPQPASAYARVHVCVYAYLYHSSPFS